MLDLCLRHVCEPAQHRRSSVAPSSSSSKAAAAARQQQGSSSCVPHLLNEAVQGGALAEGPAANGVHAADLRDRAGAGRAVYTRVQRVNASRVWPAVGQTIQEPSRTERQGIATQAIAGGPGSGPGCNSAHPPPTFLRVVTPTLSAEAACCTEGGTARQPVGNCIPLQGVPAAAGLPASRSRGTVPATLQQSPPKSSHARRTSHRGQGSAFTCRHILTLPAPHPPQQAQCHSHTRNQPEWACQSSHSPPKTRG